MFYSATIVVSVFGAGDGGRTAQTTGKLDANRVNNEPIGRPGPPYMPFREPQRNRSFTCRRRRRDSLSSGPSLFSPKDSIELFLGRQRRDSSSSLGLRTSLSGSTLVVLFLNVKSPHCFRRERRAYCPVSRKSDY
ncbi:hypothetical protein ACI65C_001903 [Semiaphis heraclei]